jgi:hypothetical protein
VGLPASRVPSSYSSHTLDTIPAKKEFFSRLLVALQ